MSFQLGVSHTLLACFVSEMSNHQYVCLVQIHWCLICEFSTRSLLIGFIYEAT